jgi:hypothetical protein
MAGTLNLLIEPAYPAAISYQQHDIPVYFDYWRPEEATLTKRSDVIVFT